MDENIGLSETTGDKIISKRGTMHNRKGAYFTINKMTA